MSEASYLTEDLEYSSLAGYRLKINSPKQPPLYDLHEVIPFEIFLTYLNRPVEHLKVQYEFIWEFHDSLDKGEIAINNGKASISFQATKPGFVIFKVSVITKDGLLEKKCGAGFSVDKLMPSLEMPKDFDEFWAYHMRRLNEIPIEASYQKITKSSHPHLHDYSHKMLLKSNVEGLDINYVQVKCIGGKPVCGILVMPSNAKEKALPAILCVHGAGVMPTQPHNYLEMAKRGAIVFEINAHGIPDDCNESFYQNLRENELKGYTTKEFSTANDFYFLNMFLRVKRGLEFLKSLPQWNQKKLFIRGGSQGGAQSLAGAYLEKDVTGFIALVPGFCDHSGALVNRPPGWPHLVPIDKLKSTNDEKLKILSYFDAANFMHNITADGFFAIGYLDGTCKATSIYVAYNQKPMPKIMVHQPYSAHSVLEETYQASLDFMYQHLGI